MLTGVPPRVHGVRRNGNKLAGPSVSLPELLRERGFGSAAFLGANFLSGITGDFDHVSAAAPTTPQQIDRAIEWARARGGRPSFLWLHLYDPHRWKRPKLPAWAREAVVDSRPRESGSFFDYVSRLHGLTAAGPAGQRRLHWWGADGHGQKYSERSREEVLEFIDDYDGLIRFADSEIQRLYEALAGEASPGRTLWIVTCDHGEGLGSHRYEGHGGRIYNEQLRVALLFHATDGSLTPRRVTELVGHMDLLPTLAELFGLDWRAPHEEHFGRSLVPVLRGTGALPERLLFAEQRRAEDAEAGDAGEIVAIQDLRHKLIQNPDGSEEFFALDDDPLELRELADPGRRRDELRAALEQRLEFFSGLSTRKLEEPAPEFLEELQDLGYAR
jgi:arylsulfatase A-like enzyme